MRYQCPECKSILSEPNCPDCPDAKPYQYPQDYPERNTAPSESTKNTYNLQGEERLRHYIDENYALPLMAGVFRTGKTQILKGFDITDQPGYNTEGGSENDIIVRGTHRGEIFIKDVNIKLAGRKTAFVDISGEHFVALCPDMDNQNHTISEQDLLVLKLLATTKKIAGLVLVIDLTTQWNAYNTDFPAYRQQIQIASSLLLLLRWLTYDPEVNLDANFLSENPNLRMIASNKVAAMGSKKRLNFPVLVLFSKADELWGKPIPEYYEQTSRCLYPAYEKPYFIARHCLRELHDALLEHARFFHFDFCHAIEVDLDTGMLVEGPPIGVGLALRWLLSMDKNIQKYRWNIDTKHWITAQWWLDLLTWHRSRWVALEELKSKRQQ